LRGLLQEVLEISYFDDEKGPTHILCGNITSDGRVNNSNSCGGPLSWRGETDVRPEIRVLLRSKFTPDVDLGHIGAKLKTTVDLLDDFVICLAGFNKRWQGGQYVKTLEDKYQSKIFDEVQAIEQKANLLKKRIDELGNEINNMVKPGFLERFLRI
jgi:hypothetical protein